MTKPAEQNRTETVPFEWKKLLETASELVADDELRAGWSSEAENAAVAKKQGVGTPEKTRKE